MTLHLLLMRAVCEVSSCWLGGGFPFIFSPDILPHLYIGLSFLYFFSCRRALIWGVRLTRQKPEEGSLCLALGSRLVCSGCGVIGRWEIRVFSVENGWMIDCCGEMLGEDINNEEHFGLLHAGLHETDRFHHLLTLWCFHINQSQLREELVDKYQFSI